MADPLLNNMLKWGVQNSDVSRGEVPSDATPRQLSASDREAFDLFMAQFKGPSDARRIDMNLDIIESKDTSSDDKYEAFENIEGFVGQIDNAHNLENDGRWTRLINQLENDDPVIRELASWCCGVAVQNNLRSQERLLIMGVLPTLVRLATADSEPPNTRKKATNALSSAIRNFQPGLDAVVSHVPAQYKPQKKLDANDMESVDTLINKLRESI